MPLSEILKAMKATVAAMKTALSDGNPGEAERLTGLLDYLIDKAMNAKR